MVQQNENILEHNNSANNHVSACEELNAAVNQNITKQLAGNEELTSIEDNHAALVSNTCDDCKQDEKPCLEDEWTEINDSSDVNVVQESSDSNGSADLPVDVGKEEKTVNTDENGNSIKTSNGIAPQDLSMERLDSLRLDPSALRKRWNDSAPASMKFSVDMMTLLLDHDNHEKREKFRKIISKEASMRPQYDISMEEEREQALR